VIQDELRLLWGEPRVPDPPVRVRRDWVLLAAGLTATVIEAVLRDDVPWETVSVLLSLQLCVVTLWRRRHPLAMLLLALGPALTITLVENALGRPEPSGLDTAVIVLVLVYAVPRWGSGRDVVIGAAAMLAVFTASMLGDDELTVGQRVGAFVFFVFPALLGAAVRFWSTARRRQLDRMRSAEREQLARELHDTVAHHVSALVIRAQAGRILADADPGAAARTLDDIEEEGARTLEAMRAMVGTLREPGARAELTPLGGMADLERLVRRSAGPLHVDLRLEGDLDDLPPAVDAAVYRIVQESLTNAARHAVRASGIRVRVSGDPDRVRVEIEDDGALTRPGARPDGYGLTGLHERATLLGGVLRAGPAPDRGWVVEAELPRTAAPPRGRP
jgi:signal transduction histidine kinase